MNLRRDILQIIFSALIVAIFIQVGWLRIENPFWSNVFGGVVATIISRILALVFGGK